MVSLHVEPSTAYLDFSYYDLKNKKQLNVTNSNPNIKLIAMYENEKRDVIGTGTRLKSSR